MLKTQESSRIPLRRLGRNLLMVLALGCALPASAADLVRASDPPSTDSAVIDTIDKLWAGYDPTAEPLEVEVVKEWVEDGARLQQVYFTGETFEGEKTRVWALIGAPVGGSNLPGLLHVHGGGQTAFLDWPKFWAKRGYVCVSFDFCGNTNLPTLGPEYRRERYTLWGKVPANMMQVGGGQSMQPTPKHNPWYHWLMAARRAITLLQTRPEVDSEKIGVFGVSVGGGMSWMLAGLDPRIKAAVPIYGGGAQPLDQYNEPVPYDEMLHRRLITPHAYTSRIRCPILFLSGSNDGYGEIDNIPLAFSLLPEETQSKAWALFSPNTNHHVAPPEQESLPLFMDYWLKGKGTVPKPPNGSTSPHYKGGLEGTVLRSRVMPDKMDEVESVTFYYCLDEDKVSSRFWRQVKGQLYMETKDAASDRKSDPCRAKINPHYFASLPVVSLRCTVFVFSNVRYKSGLTLSTKLEKVELRKHSESENPKSRKVFTVVPSLKRADLIDAMETAYGWGYVGSYTEPNKGLSYLQPWSDADGEQGFTLNPALFDKDVMKFWIGTQALNDPQYHNAGSTQSLCIDYLAANTPTTLVVKLGDGACTQTLSPAAPSDPKWKTIRLRPADIIAPDGTPWTDWDQATAFTLKGTALAASPPVFKRLRWAVPDPD